LEGKIKINTVITYIFFFLFLLSSFDIFLNIKIFGYNIRSIYILEFFLASYILSHYFYKKDSTIKLINYRYLFIWFFIVFLFIPNTTVLTRNIGYAVWLLLSILLIGIMSTLIRSEKMFYKVMHLYIMSFCFIAIFGLIQFVVGLFGIKLLTTQWWIYGVLPRINGFNYEPSYYGSYLIIGWTLLLYLIFHNDFFAKKYKKYFFVITISLILSSSRMAILTMLLSICSLILVQSIKKFLKGKISKKLVKYVFLLVLIFILLIIVIINYWNEINFLFSGLGIFGSSSHSSGARIKTMIDTFRIFLNSPIIGYSLGGIPSAIAQLGGYNISTQIEAKNFEGMNIFLEVLAASGIIGYIFFLLFIYLLYFKAFKIAKAIYYKNFTYSIIVKSLIFSLFWEMFILSMNQNILRPYLWIAIGMLSSSIFVGRELLYEANINNRL